MLDVVPMDALTVGTLAVTLTVGSLTVALTPVLTPVEPVAVVLTPVLTPAEPEALTPVVTAGIFGTVALAPTEPGAAGALAVVLTFDWADTALIASTISNRIAGVLIVEAILISLVFFIFQPMAFNL